MICKNNCNVSRDFLGRPIVAGGYGEGGGGTVHPSYGSRAKPWWGPCGKAPRSSKDLVLKSLTFD